MPNSFYNPSGYPATRSPGSSLNARAEFLSIQAGFDKLPTLSGNGSKLLRVNAGGTAIEAFTHDFLTTAAAAATYLPRTGGTMTGPIFGVAGSAAAPGYGFSGDGNNGWWSPGADTQAWSVAGVEAMRLDPTSQLLIGATTGLGSSAGHVTARGSTPRIILQVTSDVQSGRYEVANTAGAIAGRLLYDITSHTWQVQVNGGTTRFAVASTGVITAYGNIAPDVTGSRSIGINGSLEWNSGYIRSITRQSAGALTLTAEDAAGTILFRTGASERLRIDSAGDIGVGTVGPLSKLDVVGTISFNAGTAADPALRPRGDLDTGFFTPAADMLSVSCGGAEVARFRSGPFFQVGTTLTSATFMVDRLNGASTAPALAGGTVAGFLGNSAASSPAYIALVSGNTGAAGINFGDTDADSRGWVRYANSTDALQFGTAGATEWQINSTGRLEPTADASQDIGTASLQVLTVNATALARSTAGALTISSGNAAGTIDFRTAGASRADITAAGVFRYGGLEIGYRHMPGASVTTGSIAATDSGKCVYATAGVTIPNSVFAAENVVVVQNTTGSAITITKSITTAYNTATGTTLGATFTLAARGRMSIVFTSGTVCYVSGNIS